MSSPTMTAGQRWLAKRMKNPTFAAAFKRERKQLDDEQRKLARR